MLKNFSTMQRLIGLVVLIVIGSMILFFIPEKNVEQPQEQEVVEEPSGYGVSDYNTNSTVKWIVPEGTNKITVRILAPNGRYINEYEITRYLSIYPGQRVVIKAE